MQMLLCLHPLICIRLHGASYWGRFLNLESASVMQHYAFQVWSSFEVNLVYGVIAVGTSLVVSWVFAFMAEYMMHNAIFATIAGAIGGGVGQRFGRSLSGLIPNQNDEFLTRFQFEQIYREHLYHSYLILFVAITCGSVIGLSIHYWKEPSILP
jgi:hypothetical protein